MTHEPSTQYFSAGKTAIRYAEWPGDDLCLLFIHGITGTLDTWTELVPEIANGHRALSVDLRGHGRSGHTTGAYRLEDYAADMAALIEDKRIAPVIAIGHSLGAMTALELAASRPDLVSAIVLEDPPLFAREIMEKVDPSRFDSFKRTEQLANSGLSVSEIARVLGESMPDAPEEYVLERARRLFLMDGDVVSHVVDQRVDWTPTIEETMRSVQCPALLLQGNFDLGGWMRDEDGDRAARLIPDCTLSRWPDTGHGMHSAHPDRFAEEARRFIEKTEIDHASS